MFLYGLTLQPGTAISCAVYGNFSSPKAQEIVVGRGKILELLRSDKATGKLVSVVAREVVGLIRSVVPFRMIGGTTDYIVVGSDSGKVVILEYDGQGNCFRKVHEETYGKTGCRRIVPGQMLAADPRGRGIMIAANEKQKLVYILNRDTSTNLTISSPLEAHKSQTAIFSVVGVDMGFDNPIFAVLEVEYDEVEWSPEGECAFTKLLTYYELDLGLNHVVRKWNEPVDPTSNLLIAVPGGPDKPGGVLVCSENFVTYMNQDHAPVVASLPRRSGLPDSRSTLIVTGTMHMQKSMWFFLLQSEYGDLYRVTLASDQKQVHQVIVHYFDTLPGPCTAIAVQRNGFLFAAHESGNHGLYQFLGIGDKDDAVSNDESLTLFEPRPLRWLALTDEVESTAPIVDAAVADLTGEQTAQMYAVCGSSTRSTVRVLRHGMAVTELAVSQLPGNPNRVWTVKEGASSAYDRYIVVSFTNATLVLAVGDDSVAEVSSEVSGFVGDVHTLHAAALGEDSMVQVHAHGMRHIKADKRVSVWPCPGKKTITHVTSNAQQVVLALSGGELYYFELDASGVLVDRRKVEYGYEVASLSVAPVPEGLRRARFLAVGDYEDNVRILSLEQADGLERLALQQVSSRPVSLCIAHMYNTGVEPATSQPSLFLFVGLQNGILQRTLIDPLSGELTDTRSRFLGTRPVQLHRVTLADNANHPNAVLALSSRSWLSYNHASRLELAPLSYIPLESAANFNSAQCPDGFVAIADNTLRIITHERIGGTFNQSALPLRYTPRRLAVHAATGHVVIIESEAGTEPIMAQAKASTVVKDEAMQMGDNDGSGSAPSDPILVAAAQAEAHSMAFGPQRSPPESAGWASCIRVWDPRTGATTALLELSPGEAAFSLCVCEFAARPGQQLIVVGTGKRLQQEPTRQCEGGSIKVYAYKPAAVDAATGVVAAAALTLVHSTDVNTVPLALCAYEGRLLAGVGNALRIYDIGKRKLLRKCENKSFPLCIRSVHAQFSRIFVGDVAESFFCVKYRADIKRLIVVADDVNPRWLTAACALDYDTIAGADKFGNVFIDRIPKSVNVDLATDPGDLSKWNSAAAGGAPHRFENLVEYHVGEVVNSLVLASFVPGGTPALIYTTLSGAVGALLPFATREDVDFFTNLEALLRNEDMSLVGRDHMSFRSYYFPVKGVVDGDLCEAFMRLPAAAQRKVALELDRNPDEVLRKLEDMHKLFL